MYVAHQIEGTDITSFQQDPQAVPVPFKSMPYSNGLKYLPAPTHQDYVVVSQRCHTTQLAHCRASSPASLAPSSPSLHCRFCGLHHLQPPFCRATRTETLCATRTKPPRAQRAASEPLDDVSAAR